MTCSHAKAEGQRSVGAEDRVEEIDGHTDRRTEEIALPVPIIWSVGPNNFMQLSY